MAGKTNLTATLFAQKKLLAKTSTGVHRADNQEPLPSSVQVGASTIFSQDIPTSPSNTLFTVQSASNGSPATVEYVEFALVEVTGSTYDANAFDPDAVAQGSGPHTYRLALTGSYQSDSNNSRRGSWPYVDDQILHWSLGGLQLVPPTFSNDIPNPYTLTIYSGSRDVDDQIPLLDELDWQIDYYSGILFLQDYDPSKIPTRAKGFIYVGDMLSASLGTVGGGGAGVGWIAPSNGTITTTGSLLIGTNTSTPGNAEISFGAAGSAVFNEKGRDADFRVEAVGKPNAIKVDASTKQVLILSGGSADSYNEASGTDVGFYVSGSTGTRGSSGRSISLFGGDMHISGNLTVGGSSPGGGGGGIGVGWIGRSPGQIDTTGSLGVSGSLYVSEYIRHIGDDNTYLRFQSDDINFQVGGKSFLKLREEASLDQVLILSGGSSFSVDPKDFTDTALFVSGAIDSRGTDTPGAAVFGGDVVVSGTISINRAQAGVGSSVTITSDGKVGIGSDTPSYKLSVGGNMDVGEYIYHKNDANTYLRFQEDQLHIRAGGDSMIKMKEDSSNQVLILSGGSGDSPDPDSFADTNFFVSGSIGSIGTSTAGTSVFGGDVFVSGSSNFSLGMSGSLTQLVDGSSYLIAGSNITIASSSNGSITIGASSGGSVSFSGGVGSNNQMITADGSGDIVAESNITFNGNQLDVTGSILPGSDKVYDLGSENARWANIYTGDLHLKNERGHWQIVEERDHLTVINRHTGVRYKMVLAPYEESN